MTGREYVTRNEEPSKGYVVLVDDEISILETVAYFLTSEGYSVLSFNRSTEALAQIPTLTPAPDLIVTDLRMPKIDGIELIKQLNGVVEAQFLVVTAFADDESALQAMKLGAYDYLIKPYRFQEFGLLVEKALEKRRLERELDTLRLSTPERSLAASQDPHMQSVLATVDKVAPLQATVLLTGESGVGKEVTARYIWQHSQRRSMPFVPINCGAIPEPLVESELFGYEKGAFTGAEKSKAGLFEQANKGTLFLDEIGELSLGAQVKLLRVLQEGIIRRVGGISEIEVDVRIICATNRDLEEQVQQGHFREDLFYRINVVQVKLPPLRERRQDILFLANLFKEKYARQHQIRDFHFSDNDIRYLSNHSFPGNIRELQNWVERTLILGEQSLAIVSSTQLTLDSLLDGIEENRWTIDEALQYVEHYWLRNITSRHPETVSTLAKRLQLSDRQMRYKLQKSDQFSAEQLTKFVNNDHDR